MRGGTRALLGLCLAVRLLVGACAGDDDESDSTTTSAAAAPSLDDFESAVTPKVQEWAAEATDKFIEALIASTTSEIQASNQGSGLPEFICQQLEPIAASGDDEATEDAVSLARDLVVDGGVTALLKKALAAEPAERDRLLNGLHVEADNIDPATQQSTGKVMGFEALQKAGIVDAGGALAIPKTDLAAQSETPYGRYRSWLTGQAPGFAGAAGILASGIPQSVETCAEEAQTAG